jgi:hypothetical protein
MRFPATSLSRWGSINPPGFAENWFGAAWHLEMYVAFTKDIGALSVKFGL